MTSTIRYTSSLEGLTSHHLQGGFFDGWPNPPSPETHMRLLQGSYRVWLALDDSTGQVVGFINAISDGVLSAFIPLLEVLPAYKHQGVGTELVQRMFDSLSHLYAIDLVCDEDVKPFYQRFSMWEASAMLRRNYVHQQGVPAES